MKRILALAALGLAVLGAVLAIRTARFTSRQVRVPPAAGIRVDRAAAAQRLAQAITYRTVSHQEPGRFDAAAFLELARYLESAYPAVARTLVREVVGGYSLLYRWEGSDRTRSPVVLLAHLDVVPVEPGTEGEWLHDPFGGEIAEGFVWGRGALDDKSGVIAILEAVEALAAQGFSPRRTVYLSFGHDEEMGGRAGAAAIARRLADDGVAAQWVLDEGGVVAEGLLPAVDRPVALVGIAEKGYLTLELRAEVSGGHSAMPPAATAVGRVSAAVSRLERRQLRSDVSGVAGRMFDYLGPELGWVPRLVMANRWLFGGLVERALAATPEGNALLRTTTAATMIEGGVKENVLPVSARALVNFRILPGETIASVTRHVRDVVADTGIVIRAIGNQSEPSPVSSVDGEGFRLLQRTIGEVFPDVIVAPYLVLGGTDARHFTGLSDQVFRFSGARVGPDNLDRVHGTNERLSVEDLEEMIVFFIQLLRSGTSG